MLIRKDQSRSQLDHPLIGHIWAQLEDLLFRYATSGDSKGITRFIKRQLLENATQDALGLGKHAIELRYWCGDLIFRPDESFSDNVDCLTLNWYDTYVGIRQVEKLNWSLATYLCQHVDERLNLAKWEARADHNEYNAMGIKVGFELCREGFFVPRIIIPVETFSADKTIAQKIKPLRFLSFLLGQFRNEAIRWWLMSTLNTPESERGLTTEPNSQLWDLARPTCTAISSLRYFDTTVTEDRVLFSESSVPVPQHTRTFYLTNPLP